MGKGILILAILIALLGLFTGFMIGLLLLV